MRVSVTLGAAVSSLRQKQLKVPNEDKRGIRAVLFLKSLSVFNRMELGFRGSQVPVREQSGLIIFKFLVRPFVALASQNPDTLLSLDWRFIAVFAF